MNSPSRLPIQSMSNPFVHSLNPSLPEQYSPYNYHNVAQNASPYNRQLHRGSFKQEELTQEINLNDNVSFARNFKARLYEADPQEELSKHKQQDRYRQQLKMQMEDDRRRKAAKKAKEEEEDMKLEKKFYDNIKIEAQKKANKKEEPNYFVMRTAKGHRKHHHKGHNSPEEHLNQSQIFQASKTYQVAKGDVLRRTLFEPPKIMKRGGYHNQSSLDQPRQPTREFYQNPEEPQAKIVPPLIITMNQQQKFTKEIVEEQDRISKLLIFQQNMLKKLDHFKRQIYQTSNSLKLEEEFEKVKLRLRAKPINMQKIQSLAMNEGVQDFLQNTDMYRLPVINKQHRKIYEGEREIKKKKMQLPIDLQDKTLEKSQKIDIELKKPEIREKFESKSVENDKNFHQPESVVDPLPGEHQLSVQPQPVLDQQGL